VYLERLSDVSRRIDGAVALTLVAADGISIESLSSDPALDLDTLAAEMVAQARAIALQQKELAVGEVVQLTVSGEAMTFLLSSLGRGFWLLAALGPEAILGRARFELKRAALLFENDLD
jgi:predicted regulator of Ras-like GTPase activity (Roadblock/LC7/MglB family)